MRPERLRANSDLPRRQSEKVRRWPDGWAGPVLLAGDFNTPPESIVYRECWSPYANAFSSAGLGSGPPFFSTARASASTASWPTPAGGAGAAGPAPPVGSPHRPVLADWGRGAAPG
jgi:endonuclease/exonuclease/phosphatase (EEP) superfamily protein YafD